MIDDFEGLTENESAGEDFSSSEPVGAESFEPVPEDPLPMPTDPLPVEDDAPPSAPEDPLPVEDDALPPAPEDPLPVEDDAPPSAPEDPLPGEDDALPPAPEDPLPVEDEALPPVEGNEEVSSGGGGAGSVSLDSALGSLTAYLDTRQQLSNPELELAGIETFALSPITESEGLKGILLEILGPYDNIVTQYRYQQSNNQYYTYVNEVTPDYPWIASALLFIVLLWSLFRLLGRCFSWMK